MYTLSQQSRYFWNRYDVAWPCRPEPSSDRTVLTTAQISSYLICAVSMCDVPPYFRRNEIRWVKSSKKVHALPQCGIGLSNTFPIHLRNLSVIVKIYHDNIHHIKTEILPTVEIHLLNMQDMASCGPAVFRYSHKCTSEIFTVIQTVE